MQDIHRHHLDISQKEKKTSENSLNLAFLSKIRGKLLLQIIDTVVKVYRETYRFNYFVENLYMEHA